MSWSHLFFMKKTLHNSEWSFIFSMLIVMAAFIVITKVNKLRYQRELNRVGVCEEVLVTILGEVRKPGVYKVVVGTPLKDIMRKAKPKKFSNLKDLLMKKNIEESTTVVVKELEEISVRINGEVESPVVLKVKPRTRICDLKSRVTLTKEADDAFFKKRKHLVDGEVIKIPKKTVE